MAGWPGWLLVLLISLLFTRASPIPLRFGGSVRLEEESEVVVQFRSHKALSIERWQRERSVGDRHGVYKMSQDSSPLPTRLIQQLVRTLGQLIKLDKTFPCEICKILTALVQELFAEGKSQEEVVEILTKVCITLGIEDVRVCEAITREFKTEVLTVVDRLALSPSEICGLVFGEKCAPVYNPLGNWTIKLPTVPKPPITPHKLPKAGAPKLRILHMSDIHFDRFYKEGSSADCDEPLCCRADDGKPVVPGSRAGKWGDYRNCDIPLVTLENLFAHLNQTRDQYDYILWTGDLPAHDVWNQTRDDQTGLIRTLTQLFVKYLPHTPVFPALGNHESAPCNSFPPPFITGESSISWLYDALADSWNTWLPPQATPTVKYGAYYTISPFPGFRIISINTNYCNTFNWWLLLNTTDPAGELNWLISVLQKAENMKEKVHIIGHIPPGRSDCLKAWSWNYYKIINRYESTVTAQFFGHTHYDHYEMFYDETDMKRPLGVAYIVGSVTTFPDLNPGYRIYEVDGNYPNSSWAVLDHTNYILNLSRANQKPDVTPTWDVEYSAKAAYGLPSLFPADWSNLIDTLSNNQSTFDLFYRYYKKSHVRADECDAACRAEILCGLRNGRSHDNTLCT